MEPDDTAGADSTESSDHRILKTIIELKDAIWQRRPILGEIMRQHGQQTVADYARDFVDVNPSPRLDERKAELIAMVEKLLAKRLNPTVAHEVAEQLTKKPLVSTIDHHGPITHPFFVNSNIIGGLPITELNDPVLKYQVVLSFSSVSVNNASAYPRGILFHGGAADDQLIRLPILPDRSKMGVVYSVPGFTRVDLDKALRQLDEKIRAGTVTAERAAQVRLVLEEIFAAPDVLETPDLVSQITKVNFALWPKFFSQNPNSGEVPPGLIYLDIESLVTEMLLDRHLADPTSLMYRVLFDPSFRELAIEHFDGIPGAFSKERGTGTFFFWGIDNKQHRVGMQLDGQWLTSPEGTIRVPMTPEGIAEALRNKTIFPSMLTCYLMVSLYYGMKCLGGFCQVHDLTLTKRAWRTILTTVGHTDEAEALVPVQTKELGGDGMVLAYRTLSDGERTAATGIDLMLDSVRPTYDHCRHLACSVTFDELMSAMLPEMYTVLYAAPERQEHFVKITPAEILRAIGLSEKLHRIMMKLNGTAIPAPVVRETIVIRKPT